MTYEESLNQLVWWHAELQGPVTRKSRLSRPVQRHISCEPVNEDTWARIELNLRYMGA